MVALDADQITSGEISGYDVFENHNKIIKLISEVAKIQVALYQPPPNCKRTGKYFVKFILKSGSVFENSCILTDKGT